MSSVGGQRSAADEARRGPQPKGQARWILQTFPAIVFGLYTRWFHRWGLLAGWAVGMVYGTITAYNVVNPARATTSAARWPASP